MTRLPPEDRPSARDLAAGGGALCCPKCGCRDFRSGRATTLPSGSTQRYEYCRHCGHGVVTKQQPKQIIREIKPRDDDDEEEPPTLKVRSA